MLDQCAVGRPEVGLTARQFVEHMPGAAQKLFGPGPHIVGRNRLRCEFRNIVAARKRKLHLGDPLAGLPHPSQIGSLFIALDRNFRCQQPLLVDETIEISVGDRPRVALVLDEAMNDGDRAAGLPSTSSTVPSRGGVLAKPTVSVRKRPISISGLIPGTRRRNSLTT